MKYFEIQDSPELKYGPRIMRWFEKFDVRNIKMETFPKLPKRQIFFVESSEKTMYTDIVIFPFLLISPKVLEVIKMYKERCFYRDAVLLDQGAGKAVRYYLPVFDETSMLQVVEKNAKNGKNLFAKTQSDLTKVFPEKHIFWVRDSFKRHTIISLDMAESLLNREITGLGLKEIELFIQNQAKEE